MLNQLPCHKNGKQLPQTIQDENHLIYYQKLILCEELSMNTIIPLDLSTGV